MRNMSLTAACLAAGLVAAWPGESPAATMQVEVTAGTQKIDQLWFYYMVGNSPIRVATSKTDLGSLSAGQTVKTTATVPDDSGWDSWAITGYLNPGDGSGNHLVVSMSDGFATSILTAPTQSFAQVFNQADGTRMNGGGTMIQSADGTVISNYDPDGSQVIWDEASVVGSLLGTYGKTWSYQGIEGGRENLTYAEAFLGDASYNLSTDSGTQPYAPDVLGSGTLVSFSDAQMVGSVTVSVPEPAALSGVAVAAVLLRRRRTACTA